MQAAEKRSEDLTGAISGFELPPAVEGRWE